jgi:hypothetical protein
MLLFIHIWSTSNIYWFIGLFVANEYKRIAIQSLLTIHNLVQHSMNDPEGKKTTICSYLPVSCRTAGGMDVKLFPERLRYFRDRERPEKSFGKSESVSMLFRRTWGWCHEHFYECKLQFKLLLGLLGHSHIWRHNIQPNDKQDNNIWNNDIQDNGAKFCET